MMGNPFLDGGLYARCFAFDWFESHFEGTTMKKYDVILKQKDHAEFVYRVDAVGFRSAYTAAKRLHAEAAITHRSPVVRIIVEEVTA